MSNFLIYLHALFCLLIMGYHFSDRSKAIELPALINFVFVGWVLPQIFGLWSAGVAPDGALDRVVFFSAICLLSLFFGYNHTTGTYSILNVRFDDNKLFKAAVIYSLLGAGFFWKVNMMASEASIDFGGGWTGIITIYVFLGKLLTIGMIIFAILYFKNGWAYAGSGLFLCLLFYVDRIVFYGRRAPIIELVMMFVYGGWFCRGVLFKRRYFIAIFLLGMLWINSIGDYRSTMLNDDFSRAESSISDLLEIDYFGNLMNIFSGAQEIEEITNAAYMISASSIMMKFDYGLSLWNAFVLQFFPGQIFGSWVKTAIMFDLVDPVIGVYSYNKNFGTTVTGMTDSFLSFWYFGCIKFFVIGYLFKKIYVTGLAGGFLAQAATIYMATPALHAVTHDTHHYFLAIFEFAFFVLPIYLFCRKESA